VPRGPNNIDWATADSITIYRPACPRCLAEEYEKLRTDDNGDGSHTRKVRCRACGNNFKIIVESLPDLGKDH